MDELKKRLLKEFGYIPSESEIINQYYCGELSLTDREENTILEYLEKTNN